MVEQWREMLDLEARPFRHVGAKDRVIREQFGMSPVAYRVRLLGLLEEPAAVQYRPDVVRRLRGQVTPTPTG